MIADGLDVENLRFKTSQPMTAQASKKKLVCVINFGKCE
jgi:hypothetical protein